MKVFVIVSYGRDGDREVIGVAPTKEEGKRMLELCRGHTTKWDGDVDDTDSLNDEDGEWAGHVAEFEVGKFSRFYNGDGSLSEYAFTCGYTETYRNGDDWLCVSHRNGAFHAQGFVGRDHVSGAFGTLKEARDFVYETDRYLKLRGS